MSINPTMRTATATVAAAAAALLVVCPAVGVAGDEGAAGLLRRSAAAAEVTVDVAPSKLLERNSGNEGLLTLPLLPHHEVLNRRRRERRLAAMEGTLTMEETFDLHSDDDVPTHAYPRRRAADVTARTEILALYQGYGTHYVDLWIGTPPQRETVIVDTGSGVTAFPCSECHDCGEERYHTDGLFVEKQSSTFHPVTCDQCTLGPCGSLGHDGLDEVCLVSMRYEEGSSWKAYESEDVVYPGGPHAAPLQDDGKLDATDEAAAIDGADPEMAESFRFPLKFGCQTSLTGLFKTQLADGIVGMENAPTSLWSQMHKNGVTQKRAFSLCYIRQQHAEREGNQAGALTLGGSDERLHRTPMVWAENVSKGGGWYSVEVRSIYIRPGGGFSSADPNNDKVVKIEADPALVNRGGIIVDSGTTDTYFKRSVRPAFQKAWKAATGQDMPVGGSTLHFSSQEELDALPTFLIQLRTAQHLDGSDIQATQNLATAEKPIPGLAPPVDEQNFKDVLIAVPAAHYMTPAGKENEWKMRLHFSEPDDGGGVLGANVMLGHDVTFDLDNNRIGWAESDCDYESISGKETDDQ